MKDNPVLYRKRMIPEECVLLKDDKVLELTDDIIITKWNTLKPKRELHHGFSCYFLKHGFKVSKFYRADNSLMYWYCDIVDYDFQEDTNSLIVTDLLADVVVYPDGFTKVLDLDELALAAERQLCDSSKITLALRHVDSLLRIIYEDKFDTLTSYIDNGTRNNPRPIYFTCMRIAERLSLSPRCLLLEARPFNVSCILAAFCLLFCGIHFSICMSS